jgi:hypothetical protein
MAEDRRTHAGRSLMEKIRCSPCGGASPSAPPDVLISVSFPVLGSATPDAVQITGNSRISLSKSKVDVEEMVKAYDTRGSDPMSRTATGRALLR